MAIIIFKRPSEYINRLRDYRLFIDNKMIGTIANGQTIQFETTPGEHTIVAKIDWCSSPEISLTLNDTDKKEITVSGFKNGNWIIPVAVGAILPFAFNAYIGTLLVIPAFILLVYYITVGRKKYLILNEL